MGVVVKIRLTKKFAAIINDVNLTRVQVGEVINASPRDAGVLLAEGWAVPIDEKEVEAADVVEMNLGQVPQIVEKAPPSEPAEAADRPTRVGRSRRITPVWPRSQPN
jgi:hypothetical protein